MGQKIANHVSEEDRTAGLGEHTYSNHTKIWVEESNKAKPSTPYLTAPAASRTLYLERIVPRGENMTPAW